MAARRHHAGPLNVGRQLARLAVFRRDGGRAAQPGAEFIGHRACGAAKIHGAQAAFVGPGIAAFHQCNIETTAVVGTAFDVQGGASFAFNGARYRHCSGQCDLREFDTPRKQIDLPAARLHHRAIVGFRCEQQPQPRTFAAQAHGVRVGENNLDKTRIRFDAQQRRRCRHPLGLLRVDEFAATDIAVWRVAVQRAQVNARGLLRVPGEL